MCLQFPNMNWWRLSGQRDSNREQKAHWRGCLWVILHFYIRKNSVNLISNTSRDQSVQKIKLYMNKMLRKQNNDNLKKHNNALTHNNLYSKESPGVLTLSCLVVVKVWTFKMRFHISHVTPGEALLTAHHACGQIQVTYFWTLAPALPHWRHRIWWSCPLSRLWRQKRTESGSVIMVTGCKIKGLI